MSDELRTRVETKVVDVDGKPVSIIHVAFPSPVFMQVVFPATSSEDAQQKLREVEIVFKELIGFNEMMAEARRLLGLNVGFV